MNARSLQLWIVMGMLAILLVACGDDNPMGPDVSEGYRVHATLFEDLETATITVIRLDANHPSAMESVVQIDDQVVVASTASTPERAVFSRELVPELGRAHTFSVSLEGKSASGALLTPDEASTLTFTQPPPGDRSFSPDVPLTLEWDYIGTEPGEFGLFGTNVGSTRFVVSSDTLDASARSALIQTAQWAFAPQILIRVTARKRSVVSGELAASGSGSVVEFAVAELLLNRQ